MDRVINKLEHKAFWWAIKVACGCALIICLFGRFVGFGPELLSRPMADIPIIIGQLLVIAGGLSYLGHYRLLKRDNPSIGAPNSLTSKGGLFAVVRHPMYLSDLISYSGLALLNLTPISIVLLLIAYLALVRQALVEDKFVRQKFPHEFTEWSAKTKLIIPMLS